MAVQHHPRRALADLGALQALLLIIVPLGFLGGCAGRGVEALYEARDAGEGVTETYPVTRRVAFKTSLMLLAAHEAEMSAKDEEQGVIEAVIPAGTLITGFLPGPNEETLVGVWFQDVGPEQCSVTCVCLRKRSWSMLGRGLTESQFQGELKELVKIGQDQ